MTIKNHYGVYVDSEAPTTGVLNNSDITYLQDAMYYEDGIDLDFETHIAEYHVDGQCIADPDNHVDEDECEWMSYGSSTWIIGDWRKDDDDGKYELVKDGPHGYAAIVGETYTQVVFSKSTVRCALCSPCYPGQGDIGSDGEFLTYTMPGEYMED